MNASPVARLVRLPLRFTPIQLQACVVEPVLQQAFARPLEEGELDFLRGHILEIVVSDIGLRWLITMREERLRLVSTGRPSVTVSGRVPEFLLLASRREDPDTLFFERRITVSGDTELGLLVKNLIDAMELSELPACLRQSLNFGADLVERFSGPAAPGSPRAGNS